MFWRSNSASPKKVEPSTPSSPRVTEMKETRSAEDELDDAVESLAGVFRGVARFAFDLPEGEAKQTAEVCERWATHLLTRTPPPESDGRNGESHPPGNRAARRHYVAAVRYLTGLRRSEHTHIVKSLADLRQIVWAFVRSLNQTLVADGESDGRVKEQLVRLQEAARGASTDELRREALSVVDTVTAVVEERRKRHAAQTNDLGARVAALGEALEEARREGALDPLTRLSNRRTFDEELDRTVDVSIFGRKMCLLFVDIDHFKKINDQHGHPAGDEVIKTVAACLVRTFRHRDDVVARYGGEEFAIILRDTEAKNALTLTERLLETVRAARVKTGSGEIACTISAGLTELEPGEAPASWLERTDKALYQAKREGRDRIVVGDSRNDRAA
ncbi:MAG TPA: GGDEF domain-containing protein [Polyangiaceae bacterium]|nr:GGDEF domain-containing protein [Polyangiaceae bacterium]